jgi:hypothetical protein
MESFSLSMAIVEYITGASTIQAIPGISSSKQAFTCEPPGCNLSATNRVDPLPVGSRCFHI